MNNDATAVNDMLLRPTVVISESIYEFLNARARKLRALEEIGVDSWEGYGQAMELLDDPDF